MRLVSPVYTVHLLEIEIADIYHLTTELSTLNVHTTSIINLMTYQLEKYCTTNYPDNVCCSAVDAGHNAILFSTV